MNNEQNQKGGDTIGSLGVFITFIGSISPLVYGKSFYDYVEGFDKFLFYVLFIWLLYLFFVNSSLRALGGIVWAVYYCNMVSVVFELNNKGMGFYLMNIGAVLMIVSPILFSPSDSSGTTASS